MNKKRILLLPFLVLTSDVVSASVPASQRILKEYRTKLQTKIYEQTIPQDVSEKLLEILDDGDRRCSNPYSGECTSWLTGGPRLKVLFESCKIIPERGISQGWDRCNQAILTFNEETSKLGSGERMVRPRSDAESQTPRPSQETMDAVANKKRLQERNQQIRQNIEQTKRKLDAGGAAARQQVKAIIVARKQRAGQGQTVPVDKKN